MTFAPGTKVRYKAHIDPLTTLNGIEGVVTETRTYNTTMIKVTKGSGNGQHDHLVGEVRGFSTSNFVVVEDEPREWQIGDRVKVNDAGNPTHHGLVGVITELGGLFGDGGTVVANIDGSCEAFKALKKWQNDITETGWYLRTSTLELVEEEKLEEGAEISYEQVERGQRIRVSYEAKGVIFSREGVVGKVSKNINTDRKLNWTINVLDDEAERYNGKGQRLNWGSDQQKETIVLLENVPEVDALLERLLESQGGTVIRAFDNDFLVREAFSDQWKDRSDKVYSSESVRRLAGDKIVFFVEDMEGN